MEGSGRGPGERVDGMGVSMQSKWKVLGTDGSYAVKW